MQFSIIDIESNGAAFRKESIIEIAIYRYNGQEITDQFISLVCPEDAGISTFVQKLTGITEKMVKTAPKFHEIAKRVVEITKDTVLVGHNIEFDYRMLQQSFSRLAYPFEIETIDTIPLAKKLLPNEESYSLGKLCHSIGVPLSDRHRASGDARATLELFKILMDKDEDKSVLQSKQRIVNNATYFQFIEAIIADLPTKEGFLHFLNDQSKIIRTEVCKDIHQRASSIFFSTSKRNASLQAECKSVEYELIGTPTLAKLLDPRFSKGKDYYALVYSDGLFVVENLNEVNKNEALITTKSKTLALKILGDIINENWNVDEVKSLLDWSNTTEIWQASGRKKGEKSLLLIENGKITGYAYYEWHKQIESLDKVKQHLIPFCFNEKNLLNELKLALLKKEFKRKGFHLGLKS